MTILRITLVTAVTAVATALLAASAFARAEAAPVSLPPNLPSIGLVYNGLERVTSGPCVRAFKLVNSDGCTHGPDPAPAGLDVKKSVAPVILLPAPPKVQCDGDGVTGKRVQVLYVHA